MSGAEASPAEPETWRETLARFSEPKIAMMLVLGFTAGLPFLLYFSTLGVWLERSETDVAIIGFFSWFGLAYSFKMFWAPVLDRVKVPGFTAIFGQRRAWIFVAQFCVALALIGIGISDPTRNLAATALFSGLLAFSSATQDVGIDAWRIEAASSDDEQAPLAAAYQYGYRVGMIMAGGVALFLAGIANFNVAYVAMAGIMALAAVVFAIWDRAHGVTAAAAAGLGLLGVGLFTAFNALSGLFAEGSLGAIAFTGLGWLFQVACVIAFLVFAYALTRALLDRPEGQVFSVSGLVKGSLFTVAIFASLAAAGAVIGLAVPALFGALGIAPKRSQIALWATFVAAAPFVICAILIPWIRSWKADDARLGHPVFGAFVDFFWRHGWIALLILCFVSFYRLSDIVMGIMAKPAYSKMGYAPEAIGLASGIYGVWIAFIGVALAGISALKLGLRKSLIIGAIVSVLGNLSFAWLVNQPSDTLMPILLAITADNIAGGYAGTIFVAYMSTLVNKSFAGTQYAIFSSIYSLGPKLLAGTSGVLVAQFSGGTAEGTIGGYSRFFLFAALLGLPAIALSCLTGWMKPDRKLAPIKPE